MRKAKTADAYASLPTAMLAEHFRDGPLRELIDLQRRAMMLASLEGASDHERLRHLETLMVLAMTAMENFHSFTSECQRLASSLTHAAAERH